MQNSRELMNDFRERLLDKEQHPEKYRGWKFGIPDLDNITGGIQREWFFVVAGQRKAGKTAFLTTATKSFGSQGVKFLRVSLEESNLQIAERQISLVSSIDRTVFRDITMTPQDWKEINKAADEISKYQGYWDYGIATLEQIEKLLDKLEIDMLIVDYVQLMSSPGNAGNRVAEVGALSRGFKLMSSNRHIAVLAAAQLNDQGEYLWSRDLGRDADVAIKLERILDPYGKPFDNKIKCSIADSRHSAMADFELMFNGAKSLIGSFEIPKVNLKNVK